MVSAVYDHLLAIVIVGVMFVSAVVALPAMSLVSIKAVDQQQLQNTALNVFNAMLLDTGQPVGWGSMRYFQKNDPRVQRFGLASQSSSGFYVLDPDKVQRLVLTNPLNYCDYSRVRQLLGLQDYGFRFRIIPPFNVTFLSPPTVAGDLLTYTAKVNYLDGGAIPNAVSEATIVSTKGQNEFDITQSGTVRTDARGICNGTVKLGISDPDYYTVTLRVTVADVATLVVTSEQNFNNTIARINIVYDTIILTSLKDPPNDNFKPNEDVRIDNIVAFGSDGSLWMLYDSQGKNSNDNMFNTGKGEFERWSSTFWGLHGFQPVVLIFNFWAVEQGRRQILIMMAYPELFGTTIFEYGGSPRSMGATVRVQRSVLISSMTYTAELWLWKE